MFIPIKILICFFPNKRVKRLESVNPIFKSEVKFRNDDDV